MAKPKKTLKIETLLEYANGYLASDYSRGDTVDAVSRRQGVIDLLEAALSTTDRYRGFIYLDQKAITRSKPGIYWNDSEYSLENTDPTRRMYR